MVLRDRSTADATRFNQIRDELKNSELNKVDTRTPASTIIGTIITAVLLAACFLFTK